ncbi:MAG: hypothetical protein Q9171_004362 [Xanthocarpia ochracea]
MVLDRSKLEVLAKIFEEEPEMRSLVDATGACASHDAAKDGNTSLIEYLQPPCLADLDGFGDIMMDYTVRDGRLDILEQLPLDMAQVYNYLNVGKVWRRLHDHWVQESDVFAREEAPSLMTVVTKKLGGDHLPHRQHPLGLTLENIEEKGYQSLWLHLLEAGLTPNDMNEVGSTILMIACERAPELILHANDPAIVWFQDSDGDSPVDVACRKEISEVDHYLFSKVGMELTAVKVAAAMELRAKDSPEHYDYAVAATQAWKEHGDFDRAMELLNTAWQLIEQNMDNTLVRSCAHTAIGWRKERICQLNGEPRKAIGFYQKATALESRFYVKKKLAFHTDTALLEWALTQLQYYILRPKFIPRDSPFS